MRLFPAVALVLSALLATAALGGGALAQTAESEVDDAEFEPADPEQVIELTVSEEGDTEWRIEHRFVLPEGEIDHFEAYAESIERGERPAEYDETLFQGYLQAAESATDRDMAIVNAEWVEPEIVADEAEDDRVVGVLAFEFTWENFATVDGDRIHFGDAFQTADGQWLRSLGEGQQLVINPPDSYAFEDAPPTETRNGALVWSGPHAFDEGELEIVLVQTGQVLGLSFLQVIGFGLGILLIAVVGFLVTRRYRDGSVRMPDWIIEGDLPGVPTRNESAPDAKAETGPEGTVVDYEEREDIDVELLSDEERVHRLLSENGGRMRQATIVKETGWSNAKVSQLLSEMDDADEIDKLRIGRENLITHPDVDPTEVE